MALFDLFSKRQKALRGEVPDVFTYDDLSKALRIQIVRIWTDTIGNDRNYYNTYRHAENVNSAYKFIVDTLCREYGLFKLPTAEKYNDRMYLNELANYLLQVDEVEKQLDIVELSFRYIDKFTRDYRHLGRNNASECAEVQQWKTTVTSEGSSGDLRQVFPILVAASIPHIGRNTGKQIKVILYETDKRVKQIKGQTNK